MANPSLTHNPTLAGPLAFGREAAPVSVGVSEAGVRRVVQIFENQLARGLHPGAQLVVVRRGQVVLDRASGIANLRLRTKVTPETPFMTWSCTKALTGMCVHRLVEEGKIEWDAPVARYWPEFGCRGKETATIRHVLLHQAGVPARGLFTQWLLWPNWKAVTRNVAGLPAEFPPGSASAYHLVNYGFILGEVVRRVTGRPFRDYLRQTYLEPLGLRHSWLGLPPHLRRNAAGIYAGHSTQRLAVFAFNLAHIRSAVMPAATLQSTARDLAVFYQMLLNEGLYAGRRYVKPDTIAAATTQGWEGVDGTIGAYIRWAHGFHLGGPAPAGALRSAGMGRRSTMRSFGHFGQASCMAWADPDAQIVVVFLCNRLLESLAAGERFQAISDAVWEAL